MNVLEKLGEAVRDGVYETFMEYTKTTDLKELRASGHAVTEIPLAMDGLNRFYILHRNHAVQVSCSVQFDHEIGDFVVKIHTPLETIEVLKRISAGQASIKINN